MFCDKSTSLTVGFFEANLASSSPITILLEKKVVANVFLNHL